VERRDGDAAALRHLAGSEFVYQLHTPKLRC
jgi:hypothetical protein